MAAALAARVRGVDLLGAELDRIAPRIGSVVADVVELVLQEIGLVRCTSFCISNVLSCFFGLEDLAEGRLEIREFLG